MPNPAKAERADVVATVVSVIIVIVAAVGGSLLLWAGREQLPEMVATHWGPAGRADAFKPTARLYVENAVITGVLPLLMVVIGLVMRQGRVLGPVSAATAVFMSVVINGSVWMQRGMTAEQVRDTSAELPIVVASAAAIAVGVLLWLVFRQRPGKEAVQVNIDATAPRLLVDDAVTLAWTGRTRVARAVAVVIGLGALSTAVLIPMMIAAGTWGSALLMALLTALIVVLGLAMAANVTVDGRGVRARALGFIPWFDVPLNAIAGATVVDVRPLRDFGGWGMRVGFNGERGLITAGGPALRIDRGEQGPFLVTAADAEAAAATLNTLVARRAQHDDEPV